MENNRVLFEQSPVAIWEEDFSESMEYIRELLEKSEESFGDISQMTDSVFMSLAKLDHVIWKVNTYLSVNTAVQHAVPELLELRHPIQSQIAARLRANLDTLQSELGKSPVRYEDRTGFLVNRLLIPYLLDAVRAFESGTGSMEDIDQAMKLGCGHPMGPFQLLDFIGLDTINQIASIMYEEFREGRMAPPPLLRRMVYAGRLGRKTGIGFYEYTR
ncbi:MAG: 3-hydroxyacyl-CoA dehydrogenase family protein [bacterium]